VIYCRIVLNPGVDDAISRGRTPDEGRFLDARFRPDGDPRT